MMRFTVTWLPTAERRLANLWIQSANQQAFADAADRIEKVLSADPRAKSQAVSANLFEIEMAPLVIIFRIVEDDRLVEIVDVIELGPIDS